MSIERRLRLSVLALLLAMMAIVPRSMAESLPDTTLIYVSDYVSFIGADPQGHVAFALDNNRGQDGEAYQAEHFVVLHDERQGWIEVAGNGFYDNTKHELGSIPDSAVFQFTGTPESGLTVTSSRNQLVLQIDPLPKRTRRTHDRAVTWMGSAPATLTWQDRTITGRVIYEYLVMPDFNRLSRTYWGLWKDFQGLYLLANATGDVYLHSQESEMIASFAGNLVGFSVLGEEVDTFKDLRVEVLTRDFAIGFYRWPTSWRITWTGEKGPAIMTLTAAERRKIGGWIIGGFAMAIVRGELTYDNHTHPIYGLAELLM